MTKHTLQTLALATVALFGAAGTAAAECLSDIDAAALVANYLAKTPAANPENLSTADGECSRAKVNRFLVQQTGGKVVGYKAGLTNPAVQKRFNASAPVWGVLYAPMLLADGAVLDAGFGARPLFEADMLVRVADPGINKARSPEQVLRHIDQVIPFIELPDLVVQAPARLNGAGIAAINVGARLGVVGAPLPVQRTQAFSDALRDMVVVVLGDGKELDRGKGADVLDHPLNAVVWLVQDLARHGIALKKGDLISLGSFSKLMPPKPGLGVEVVYQGLPGNPTAKVSFR